MTITAYAIDVIPADDGFNVRLADGRRLWVPYSWFPRLASATPSQRANWELIGGGIGIHWPEVDEDNAASLELRKVYQEIADRDASQLDMVRVIDESGEDYLFPSSMFLPIKLSGELRDAILRAS